MPLLSTEVYQWGLHFVAPGVFQQHFVFGNFLHESLVSNLVNTQTGTRLEKGAFPVFEGGVNTWVHVAMVVTPDEDDGGNWELASYINVSPSLLLLPIMLPNIRFPIISSDRVDFRESSSFHPRARVTSKD